MAYKDIPIKDVIEKFKTRLKNNEMNLLVGAGVSMCVSDLFKSWYGLLQDMVAYLYKKELVGMGLNIVPFQGEYCHYHIFGENKDAAIKQIIEREGVLNIPSQFVRRKGMREALEAYVESHTPKIDIDNGFIELFNKKDKITEDKIAFVKALITAGFNGIFTTNYDCLLETFSKSMGFERKSCVKAADLSLRELGDYIIKLHGSIVENCSTFDFDQDNARRYILTQDDYDDYPMKHNAFMQLMRISLLKECFCLVGFSGTDYNFISWIKWVRDILYDNLKDKDNFESDDIKIFFIDCFEYPLDKATEQFFENYGICRIVLPSEEVRDVVEIEEEPSNSNEYRRKLLKKFFEYVGKKDDDNVKQDDTSSVQGVNDDAKNENTSSVQGRMDGNKSMSVGTKHEENIKDNTTTAKDESISWANAYTIAGDRHGKVVVNELVANKLVGNRGYIKYTLGTYYQGRYIEVISKKDILTEIEAKLALLAMEQMMIEIDDVGEEFLKKIENALSSKEDKLRIRKLRLRTKTINNPYEAIESSANNDVEIYEKCLRYAFTFRYTELAETLNAWRPTEIFLVKKALFMTLTDPKIAENLITQSFIDSLPILADRQRISQLANIISGSFEPKFSTNKYLGYERQTISYYSEWFFDKSLRVKNKIKPYGADKDRKEPIDANITARSLQYMMEMPIFVQIRLNSMITGEQWYKVAHSLFKIYPYPVLFYSTTLNDRNILRRIGQDFAYSEILHGTLPQISKAIFENLIDMAAPNPNWNLNNACELLAEIIKAVPADLWEHYVIDVWEYLFFPYIEKRHSSEGIMHLMYTAFTMCKSKELFKRVVVDCLESTKVKKIEDTVQNIFYYFRVERFKGIISSELDKALVNFILSIDKEQDYAIMANLHEILEEKHCRMIAETIPKVLESKGITSVYINGLVYFSKLDPTVLSNLKKAILDSSLLWESGITDKMYHFVEYIHIVEYDEVLNWSEEEVKTLYGKLKESAFKILSLDKDSENVWNYDELISDMIKFLSLHNDSLENEVDYLDIKQKLTARLDGLMQSGDLSDALYSNDKNILNSALRELKNRLLAEGIEPNIHHIFMLLDRLLYKNKIGMQNILNYMQYFVRDFVTKESTERLPQLMKLLRKYDVALLRDMQQNVIVCTEYIILIAESLKKKELEDEGIRKWLNIKESNVFNWVICDTNE